MSTRVSLADFAEATGIAVGLLAAEMNVLQHTPDLLSTPQPREARADHPRASAARSPRAGRNRAARSRVAA